MSPEVINVEAISTRRHEVRSKNNRNLSMSQLFPVIKRRYVEAVGFARHSRIAEDPWLRLSSNHEPGV